MPADAAISSSNKSISLQVYSWNSSTWKHCTWNFVVMRRNLPSYTQIVPRIAVPTTVSLRSCLCVTHTYCSPIILPQFLRWPLHAPTLQHFYVTADKAVSPLFQFAVSAAARVYVHWINISNVFVFPMFKAKRAATLLSSYQSRVRNCVRYVLRTNMTANFQKERVPLNIFTVIASSIWPLMSLNGQEWINMWFALILRGYLCTDMTKQGASL